MSYTTRIGLCTIELDLAEAESLKAKRGILQSLITRLNKQFNVSVAEVGNQDVWHSAVIAVAVVSNSSAHANQVISNVLKWIEKYYPNVLIVDETIEML